MTELIKFSFKEKSNINIFWFAAENIICKNKIIVILKCDKIY
jgi:hypothetical protein